MIPPIDFSKLNNLIADQRTTDCLEMIEQWGFAGESGIAVLAFLQEEGAA